MGRSRGGLTTKIHALVDAMGLPIALKLTEGQAHDGRSAKDMFEALKAGGSRRCGMARMFAQAPRSARRSRRALES